MNAFETLIYEKQGSVARVILNRPRFLNAFNVQMRDDFWEVLSAVRDDDEVRVVVLMGAGDKAFCAGADLSEFLTAPQPVSAREIRFERDVWKLFLSIPQPIVVALHGYVIGSGVEIALCCDVRIASEDARFTMPEVGLGIIPAAGGTQTLPRTVGRGQALELLLTGEAIDANRACSIGLVNQVVPRKDLLPVAQRVADGIARHDPAAVRLAKHAVREGMDLPLEGGLNLERRLASKLAMSKLSRNA